MYRLKTDYTDYYDFWFGSPHNPLLSEFSRMSAPPAGYPRSEQFRIMRDVLGLNVPIPSKQYDAGQWIVIYDNEFLHAGNGKDLTYVTEGLAEAMKYSHLKLAIPYIFTTDSSLPPDDPSFTCESSRLQYVGNWQVMMQIKAQGDWRTNCAPDCEVTITDCVRLEKQEFAALYAVDFVTDHKTGTKYAIDLNMAPGLTGTGLADLMSGKEVAEEIIDWLNRHPKNQLASTSKHTHCYDSH